MFTRYTYRDTISACSLLPSLYTYSEKRGEKRREERREEKRREERREEREREKERKRERGEKCRSLLHAPLPPFRGEIGGGSIMAPPPPPPPLLRAGLGLGGHFDRPVE